MSPIKNLSDSIRLPRLGKIHLGVKHPEKGYPMKTDYFVFDKDHSLTAKAHEIFGNEPKVLRIYIPSEDDEVWCSQYYQSYDQTHGLVCRGDGDKALMMVDISTGEMSTPKTTTVALVDKSCEGKNCHYYQAKKCHERMNLRFLIPELPGLGIWQIDTGSINSILNVNSSAQLIRSAFKRISLIPLELTLEPTQANNPESGKKQTIYVLNLRTSVTIVQLAEQTRDETRKLLVAPLENYDPADLWEENSKSESPEATPPATSTPEKQQPVASKPAPATDSHANKETLPKITPESVYANMEQALANPAWTVDERAAFLKECFEGVGALPGKPSQKLKSLSQENLLVVSARVNKELNP